MGARHFPRSGIRRPWRFRGADGTYRTFFTRAVPLKDEAGKTMRWYATNTDIEEREKAEEALAQMRGEMARLSRFLTMGELTASIAHEVDSTADSHRGLRPCRD